MNFTRDACLGGKSHITDGLTVPLVDEHSVRVMSRHPLRRVLVFER